MCCIRPCPLGSLNLQDSVILWLWGTALTMTAVASSDPTGWAFPRGQPLSDCQPVEGPFLATQGGCRAVGQVLKVCASPPGLVRAGFLGGGWAWSILTTYIYMHTLSLKHIHTYYCYLEWGQFLKWFYLQKNVKEIIVGTFAMRQKHEAGIPMTEVQEPWWDGQML